MNHHHGKKQNSDAIKILLKRFFKFEVVIKMEYKEV